MRGIVGVRKDTKEKRACERVCMKDGSCTIKPTYCASYPSNDVRSKSEQNGNVLSCRNLFVNCLWFLKSVRRTKQRKTRCKKSNGESGDTRTHTHTHTSTRASLCLEKGKRKGKGKEKVTRATDACPLGKEGRCAEDGVSGVEEREGEDKRVGKDKREREGVCVWW